MKQEEQWQEEFKLPVLPPADLSDFSSWIPKAEESVTQESLWDDGHGLTCSPAGIIRAAKEGKDQSLTNFELRLSKVYVEQNEVLGETRRTTSAFEVLQLDGKKGQVLLEEKSWKTRSDFLSSIQGLGNIYYVGSDMDLQLIKGSLMTNTGNVPHVKRVHSYGIHHEEAADTHIFTYVEPGWSIDSNGVQNTHSLLGNRPPDAPQLQHVPVITHEREGIGDIFHAFYTLNEPLPAAQILGWTMSCFLKRHIETWRREFPLINVYGNASSGKTQGMMKFCQLFGVDYGRSADTINAENSRDFAIWKNLSDRETSAVILDEFNLSKLGKKRYNQIGGFLKDSYQRGTVERGTLSRSMESGASPFGASLMKFSLSSPVAVCSEQGMIDAPALITRTIQVPIRPAGLSWADSQPRRSFELIGRSRDLCQELARHCYLRAITTSVDRVRYMYDLNAGLVPEALGDRPHHGYSVLLTGLDFFWDVAGSLGIDLTSKHEEMKIRILRMFRDTLGDLINSKNRSEADIVLDTWAIMAAQVHDSDLTRDALKPEVHYRVSGDTVYFDVGMVFPTYKRYMAQIERTAPVFNVAHTFLELVRNEPYYVEERVFDDFGRGQRTVGLSLSGLKEKGVAVASFISEEC